MALASSYAPDRALLLTPGGTRQIVVFEMVSLRMVVGLVAALCCTACFRPQMRQPFRAQYDTNRRAQLWQSAVVLLQEQNYPIQLLDEASGTITTGEVGGFMVPCGILTCPAKETVSLTVSPTGVLILNVNRQVKGIGSNPWFGSDPWFVPADKKGVGLIEERQKQLVGLILARSESALSSPGVVSASPPTIAPTAAPADAGR